MARASSASASISTGPSARSGCSWMTIRARASSRMISWPLKSLNRTVFCPMIRPLFQNVVRWGQHCRKYVRLSNGCSITKFYPKLLSIGSLPREQAGQGGGQHALGVGWVETTGPHLVRAAVEQRETARHEPALRNISPERTVASPSGHQFCDWLAGGLVGP